MVQDFDDFVGFWIKGVPYVWIQGDNPYTSMRFYLLNENAIAIFDKDDYICDQYFARVTYGKTNPEETFSFFPLSKKKDCEIVRNHFLVWNFNDVTFDKKRRLRMFHKVGDKVIYFPRGEQTPDIRIEGKRYGDKIPISPPLLIGSKVEIINPDTNYKESITVYPHTFGNKYARKHPFSVKSTIVLHLREREHKFHNLREVKFIFNLDNEIIKKIHVEAIKGFLAHEFYKKKEYKYYNDQGRINRATKELESLEEKKKLEKPVWQYIDDLVTSRIIYEEVIGKRNPYNTKEKITIDSYEKQEIPEYLSEFIEKTYNNLNPSKCQVSKTLKEWIFPDKYYQDRKRKWSFDLPNELGYDELCNLSHVVENLLSMNFEFMKKKNAPGKSEKLIKEGVDIYDKKPALKSGVTWSQDDYSHLGLIREYIRYKSIQRFTETWEMMRRAYNIGLLDRIIKDKKVVCVSSLGGGPGFELYSIKQFFKVYYPEVKLIGYSLDPAESWKPYVEELGFHFAKWDSSDGEGVVAKSGGKVDFAIISYALYMYMSKNEHIKWLSNIVFTGEVPYIFVNSRMRNLRNHKNRMKTNGIYSLGLLRANDDRQMVYHTFEGKLVPPSGNVPVIFPNVPHEDDRKK